MTGIKIENIQKSFSNGRKETRVLENIDIEIEPGEFFFLLGPSGCGKTTLLRIIAGLIEPTSGKILFNGKDVTNLEAGKRNSAMVFQNYALWPHMTVQKNTEFGLETKAVPKDQRKEEALKSLQLVEMENLASRKPTQLSGGQQQRVALARAITSRPNCLLLDEPLSNLDAKLRLQMRQQLRKLVKKSGYTAIYVTHDQKEALAMADRIAVMNNGVIEQIGTPRQIYQKPQTSFVANFIGECNFINGEKNGTNSAKTSLGIIHTTMQMPDCQKVRCGVRPENTIVSPEKPESDNVFTAAITEITYLGELTQIELKTGDGQKWKSLMLSTTAGNFNPDDAVWISIDKDSVIVIAEQS
ncbi:MAG: ABC transporter ATP-binding protein [Sedimentisphaeraceae bacterium JB056]